MRWQVFRIVECASAIVIIEITDILRMIMKNYIYIPAKMSSADEVLMKRLMVETMEVPKERASARVHNTCSRQSCN